VDVARRPPQLLAEVHDGPERCIPCVSVCSVCGGKNLNAPAPFLKLCKDCGRNIPKTIEVRVIQGEHPTEICVWWVFSGLCMPETKCTK
jgi:hypothetical protein